MDASEMLAAALAAAAASEAARLRAVEQAAASEAARLRAVEQAAESDAARQRAEKQAAASEAARLTLFVESNRTRLLSPSTFASIGEWLDVHGGSNIPAIEDVKEYLSSYKNSPSNDTSFSYEDDSSCSGSIWSNDKIPMNRFRRNMTNAETSSKMRVRILNLSDEAIINLVSKRVFKNDMKATVTLVGELSVIVVKIRETLYFQDQEGKRCSELNLVQPLFALLVEHIMTHVLQDGRVGLGQGVSLQGAVLVPSPTAPAVTKTLSGNADLLFFKSNNLEKPLDDLQCVCELKSPFKKLQHSGAHASKDQLLAELEGCGQMTGEAHHIMGLLSDFFVAGVVIRAPSTTDCAYPIFYQAPREADTTSFVLRLLFVLLDLDAVDFDELLRNCETEIAVPADEESGSAEGERAAAADQSLPPGTKAAASRRQEVVTKETKDQNAKSNKLYLAAVRKEEVQIAIERDYARRGLAYLSEDELNKRNLVNGPVKRDISALL